MLLHIKTIVQIVIYIAIIYVAWKIYQAQEKELRKAKDSREE
jgi:hypothetical protein